MHFSKFVIFLDIAFILLLSWIRFWVCFFLYDTSGVHGLIIMKTIFIRFFIFLQLLWLRISVVGMDIEVIYTRPIFKIGLRATRTTIVFHILFNKLLDLISFNCILFQLVFIFIIVILIIIVVIFVFDYF